MTYGIITQVAAPAELYDGMHRQLLDHVGTAVEGLLLHVARATPTGFQIIEVWSSKELLDRYNRELVWPLLAASAGVGSAQEVPRPVEEEFEVRGLVLPSAGLGF
ncbi:hypothetical protein GCM10022197_15870 [Microlunatus spumicola]|uniref:ABM domain-containing protein n=1 Tax=Microlunatus spumicola TaxID=81499 RepID=A0ABP6X880_9ACTN